MSNGREFVFLLTGDASGIQAASRAGSDAVRGAADSTVALDRAQTAASQSSESLASSLMKTGVAGFSLFKLVGWVREVVQALVDAQIRADRLNLQLSASSGAGNAARDLNYIRETSNRLGLELMSTATAFARFQAAARGTSMEGAGVRQVFDAVSKASAAMGLNVEENTGVLRALEQMMSKGQVQAEELRGQLGDRLPGALQIAARAMGVTTGELSKMVERGEVIASEFLPRFAAQLEAELGGSAMKAADTMQAATNRMANSWELIKQDAAASGFGDIAKGQANVAADAMANLSEKMQLARRAGGGFMDQLGSAGYAVLQFLNPLNAVSYSALSLEGRLRDAVAQLDQLQASVARNPHDVYITSLRNNALALVNDLQRARGLLADLDNQSAAESKRLSSQEGAARKPEEDKARRMDALKRVTDELAGSTSKLALAQRTLAQSFLAGDIADRKEYERLVNLARKEFGPKAAHDKAGKAPPLVDQFVLDVNDARLRQAQRFAEADKPMVDFMLAQVQRSDERVLSAAQRRQEQGQQFAQQLGFSTDSVYASLVRGAEARGQAQMAIEKAQLTGRLASMKLEATERQQAEDEIARYMVARQAQLTEELKPEWQRMTEAWADTAEAMKRTSDQFLTGFLNQGRTVFEQFAMTGKLNMSSLANFVRAQFAQMFYDRFLSGAVASFGNMLFSSLFGSTGGGGASYALPSVGIKLGGGAATGTNFVERDMLTILHKGEAVVPREYNPVAGGSGGGVVITQTINVGGGASRADMVIAASTAKDAAVAQIADMLRRGHPALAG